MRGTSIILTTSQNQYLEKFEVTSETIEYSVGNIILSAVASDILPIKSSLSITQCYIPKTLDEHAYFVIDYSSMSMLNNVSDPTIYADKMVLASWSTSSAVIFIFNGSDTYLNYLQKYNHNNSTFDINVNFSKATYGTFIDVCEVSTLKYIIYLSDNKNVYAFDENLNVIWEEDISAEFPNAVMMAWAEGQIYAAFGQSVSNTLYA